MSEQKSPADRFQVSPDLSWTANGEGRLVEVDHKLQLPRAPQNIDRSMLAMLKQLKIFQDAHNFEDTVWEITDRMTAQITVLHRLLSKKDTAALAEGAYQLSNSAVMVGASQIMHSSYQLQNAARLNDFEIAEKITHQLDIELAWAKDDLALILASNV